MNQHQILNGLATGECSPIASINNQPTGSELELETGIQQQGRSQMIDTFTVSTDKTSIGELAARAEGSLSPTPNKATSGKVSLRDQLKQAHSRNTKPIDPRSADRLERPQTMLPIAKPNRNDFIMTKLEGYEEFPPVLMLEDRSESQKFSALKWLDPALAYPEEVLDKAVTVNLVLYANHQGKFFLWPLKAGEGEWHDTAMAAMVDCSEQWLSVRWVDNGYRTTEPVLKPNPVDWSKVGSVDEVVGDSLRAVRILSDDPFIRSLLGETIIPEDKPGSFLKRFRRS